MNDNVVEFPGNNISNIDSHIAIDLALRDLKEALVVSNQENVKEILNDAMSLLRIAMNNL